MATKIVVTGGPGSGKTSIIKQLADAMFKIVPEASRQLIQIESKKQEGILPWQNLEGFASLCMEWMVHDFNKQIIKDEYLFYDRGLPDIIAYLNLQQIKPLTGLEDAISQNRYFRYVYWCPPWSEIYVNDPERPQTYEEAKALGLEIKQTYQKYLYEVVEVPKVSVQLRVKFILENLKEVTSKHKKSR